MVDGLKFAKLKGRPKDLGGHKAQVISLNWSADGSKLATASTDRNIVIHNLQTNLSNFQINAHLSNVQSVVWNPKIADQLASCSTDCTVKLWDLKASIKTPTLSIQTENQNIFSAFHQSGNYLAVSDKLDNINFYDLRGGLNSTNTSNYQTGTFKSNVELNEFAWSYTENLFFYVAYDGKVSVLDWPTLDQIGGFVAHTANCFCLDFDPKGRYLATGGTDAIVGLWDLTEFTCLRSFSNVEDSITGVSFSHDGELLAIASGKGSGDRDSILEIASTENGDSLLQIVCPTGTSALKFHPSKYVLAYAREPHTECYKPDGDVVCKVCKNDINKYNKNKAHVNIQGLN